MNERPPEFVVTDAAGNEPVTFIGSPGALRGELRISNVAQEKRLFRAGQVHLGTALGSVQPAMPVAIEAGASTAVMLTAHLDPRTPPGLHTGEVSFDGGRRPARFYVTEHVSLELSPTELVLEEQPGARLTRTVVFRNAGNVPLTIGGVTPVPLEQEPLPGHKRASLLESPRVGPPTERAAPAKAGRHEEEAYPVARLHAGEGSTELSPGQVISLTITLELPKTLEVGVRYLGAVPFYAATLKLLVVARGKSTSPASKKEKT